MIPNQFLVITWDWQIHIIIYLGGVSKLLFFVVFWVVKGFKGVTSRFIRGGFGLCYVCPWPLPISDFLFFSPTTLKIHKNYNFYWKIIIPLELDEWNMGTLLKNMYSSRHSLKDIHITTLNMIFSVWLYIMLLPPHLAQH